MNIRAKIEPIVEDWWQETIDKFTDQKSTISRRVLSFNLTSFSFENRGLEWQFLDWKVIILMVFFCNVRILLIVFEF